MVISAWVLIVLRREKPFLRDDCVVMRGDDTSAAKWLNRCRGGGEPRLRALVRLLDVLELAGGWIFRARHVAGILNEVANGISCWERLRVQLNLASLRLDVRWRMQDAGNVGKRLCTFVLASGSSATRRCAIV